jgi:hypothetical protein
MASTAERMRSYRARRKRGAMVVNITADEALISRLVAAQRLKPSQTDDRAAIANAAEQALQNFSLKARNG